MEKEGERDRAERWERRMERETRGTPSYTGHSTVRAHSRTGWDRHASRTRKRRLPWHLSFHDQPQPTPAMLASSQSDSSIAGSLCSGGLYSGGSGYRGGEGRGGSASLSTTSKKTMESLSSSVYEELQPFRRAHRTLIKVS